MNPYMLFDALKITQLEYQTMSNEIFSISQSKPQREKKLKA